LSLDTDIDSIGEKILTLLQMKVELSNRWLSTDKNIHFMTNFTDVRASINFTDETGFIIPNKTYTTHTETQLVNGDNVIYNQTEVREFLFVANGKNMTSRSLLKMTGHRCNVFCNQAIIDEVAISTDITLMEFEFLVAFRQGSC